MESLEEKEASRRLGVVLHKIEDAIDISNVRYGKTFSVRLKIMLALLLLLAILNFVLNSISVYGVLAK